MLFFTKFIFLQVTNGYILQNWLETKRKAIYDDLEEKREILKKSENFANDVLNIIDDIMDDMQLTAQLIIKQVSNDNKN